MQESSEQLIQGLGRRYYGVLAIVAGLLLLDQVVLQPLLVRLNFYAPVINLAGRQRMLSQRLTKGALALSINRDQAPRWDQELRESLADWTRVHAGLQFGDRELELPGTTTPAIRAAFAELNPHFSAMCAAVESILSAPDESAHAISALLTHEQHYLRTMDRIVGMFEQESKSQVLRLRLLGLAATLAVLCLMAGLTGLVLKPATRLIRKQVARLSASEARFRLLIERMHDGLAIFSGDGMISYVNDRFAEILQRDRSELSGHPLPMFTGGEDRQRLFYLLDRAAQAAPEVGEVSWQLPQGRSCTTLVAPGRSQSDAGEKDLYFVVVTDITRQKQDEARLRDARDALELRVQERTQELTESCQALAREAAERQLAEERMRQFQSQLAQAARVTSLGQLATGIAHEINQPLGAITNYAEALQILLAGHPVDTDELQRTAARIRDAALRAGKIVSRMRNFVRRGSTPQSRESVRELVEEVLALCEPEIRRQQVQIVRELDKTGTDTVLVDPIQLQQVLVNLIQNALQAMSAVPATQRRLALRSTLKDGHAWIEVEDTGPGFSADCSCQDFTPFHTTKDDGLGMGLSISHFIVTQHGGRLWVENNSPRGARLSFSLPLANVCRSEEPADCLRCG